jgi:hypothetical protein
MGCSVWFGVAIAVEFADGGASGTVSTAPPKFAARVGGDTATVNAVNLKNPIEKVSGLGALAKPGGILVPAPYLQGPGPAIAL